MNRRTLISYSHMIRIRLQRHRSITKALVILVLIGSVAGLAPRPAAATDFGGTQSGTLTALDNVYRFLSDIAGSFTVIGTNGTQLDFSDFTSGINLNLNNETTSQTIGGASILFQGFNSWDNSYRITGGAGNDTIHSGWGFEGTIIGGAGNDILNGGAFFHDIIDGGDGDDDIDGSASGVNDLTGGDGDDTIKGGAMNDTLTGGDGDDFVTGGDGDDVIYGGDGVDLIYGEDGIDTLYGEDGNDQIHGGDGIDIIIGEDGNDLIYGEDGNDQILSGAGDDTLNGGDGADSIIGEDGNDSIIGEDGNDHIEGGAGDDTINGSDGADTIIGDAGNDHIEGSDGDDTINGSDGDDFIYGGTGADTIDGGAGTDTRNEVTPSDCVGDVLSNVETDTCPAVVPPVPAPSVEAPKSLTPDLCITRGTRMAYQSDRNLIVVYSDFEDANPNGMIITEIPLGVIPAPTDEQKASGQPIPLLYKDSEFAPRWSIGLYWHNNHYGVQVFSDGHMFDDTGAICGF